MIAELWSRELRTFRLLIVFLINVTVAELRCHGSGAVGPDALCNQISNDAFVYIRQAAFEAWLDAKVAARRVSRYGSIRRRIT